MRILATLFCASLLIASQPAMASSTPLDSTLDGTWSGSFVRMNPDGTVSHNQIVVKLEPHGSDLTGSIGSTIDNQTPFTDGHFTGTSLTFHLKEGRYTDFRLHLDNGHLRGQAFESGSNNPLQADIDLQPAPALMPHAQLVQEILDADHAVFTAYEKCDIPGYGALLSNDLEFYQDNIGVRNRSEILDAMRNRCNEGIRYRRELDRNSTVINAVPGYDAVQAGIQRIYSIQNDGSEQMAATVRFTLIWTKKSGQWQLLRVISFDHH